MDVWLMVDTPEGPVSLTLFIFIGLAVAVWAYFAIKKPVEPPTEHS